MSSLTRENIHALVQSHGIRAGYELKIMGKDDVIKGIQFANQFSSNVSGLPNKRSVVNDDDALKKLEKELLINFGKNNRRDAAERIVKNFNATTERYLLPEGAEVTIQSLDAETPTLKVSQSGRELASLDVSSWNAFSPRNEQNKYIDQSAMMKIAQQHGTHLRLVGKGNDLSAIESTINRFVLPENIEVNVERDHGAHRSVLITGVPGTLKTYEPDFESKFEQTMLSIGIDKHAVELDFSLPLSWDDLSDEDGYSFAPNIADDALIEDMRESVKIEAVNAIVGDMGLDDDKVASYVDVIVNANPDVDIEEIDFDENTPSNVRLRNKTVDDMPEATQDFRVQVLISPEFPASPETLDLIQGSVKELLIDGYEVDDASMDISIKQSTQGMPLRGLKKELTQALEQASSQYSILELEQKANKLNDVVKSVIGYTVPVIEANHLSIEKINDAAKLVSIVECSIEENMLKELASPSNPEIELAKKFEPNMNDDVHIQPYNKNLFR
jgi:hypothetical protein